MKKISEESPYGGMESEAKLLISLIFLVLLILFPAYSPMTGTRGDDGTITSTIFNLYFFIIDQTLGIVHEAGHGVCYILPCPEPLMVANGTIFQLLFPSLIAYYAKRKGEIFYSFVALFFVGFSLYYTSWYISTSDRGPIVPASESFLGVDGYHDFHYLLGHLGLLSHYRGISDLFRVISYAIMIFSVVSMFLNTTTPRHDDRGGEEGRKKRRRGGVREEESTP